MIIQTISAFFATVFFSVMFNISKRELIFCGLSGGIGWLIYLLVYRISGSVVLSTFAGSLGVSLFARLFAQLRKMPVTIYLISGIIPLVPGAGMYQTMYAVISQDSAAAAFYGIQSLQMAGVIAIAIVIISSFPKPFPYQPPSLSTKRK